MYAHCAIHDKNHVELCVGNNSSLVLFDDSGKYAQARWRAVVGIKNAVRALFPFPERRIDSLLNILDHCQSLNALKSLSSSRPTVRLK